MVWRARRIAFERLRGNLDSGPEFQLSRAQLVHTAKLREETKKTGASVSVGVILPSHSGVGRVEHQKY